MSTDNQLRLDKAKKIASWLFDFILGNTIWIVPTLSVVFDFFSMPLLAISGLISFLYLSARKFLKEEGKEIALTSEPKYLSVIYYTITWIFLAISGITIYEGATVVFGIENLLYRLIVGSLSLGIIAVLYMFTYMIKSRKTPKFILLMFVAYCLLDIPTALPFNFLFFYEQSQKSLSIEIDKRNIDVVSAKCDSIINPLLIQSVKIITDYKVADSTFNITNKSRRNARREAAAEEVNLTIEQKNKYAKNNVQNAGSVRPKKKGEEELYKNALSNSIHYHSMLDTLAFVNKLYAFVKQKQDSDSLITGLGEVKRQLRYVCNSTIEIDSSKTLKSCAKVLNPFYPTRLESLLDLYKFVWGKISGKSGDELSIDAPIMENEEAQKPLDNTSSVETGIGKKNSDMLIWANLSISIVIDILPLLLSILYAYYKRLD